MNNFLQTNFDTFSTLLKHLKEGVIIQNDDAQILYANRAAHHILVAISDTLIGKSLSDFHPIFSSNPLNTNEPIEICLLSGSTQWIQINSVLTEKKNQTGTIIFSDITEEKNALDRATLFESAVESIDVGITLADPNLPDTPLIYANPSFLDKTGYSKEEVIGRNCRFLQGEAREQSARETIRNAINEHKSTQTELLNFTKDKEPFYNLLTLSPIYLHDQLRYFVGVQHDITAIKLQEEKLKEQTIYIQNILDAQDNIVIVTDGMKIVFANKALLGFFGLDSLESFIEESTCICNRFIPDSHYFHLGKVAEGELWVNTLMRLPSEKRIVIMESSEEITHYFSAKVTHFNHRHYVVSFNDVSATLLKEEILTNKAYHDPLTGVFNRQFLHEFITKWVRKGASESVQMGVILLDIDNFKLINDTYGHLKGDDVLQSLAKILTQTIRSKDNVFRWGGEEFVIILHVQQTDQLLNISEKIRKVIEQTQIEGVGAITCSFGVTMMQQNETLEEALERADEALYQAKRSGKNRVEMNLGFKE